MQTQVCTLVQAENRTEAEQIASDVFRVLTKGGTNPLFDEYTLLSNASESEGGSDRTATVPLDSDEGAKVVHEAWEETIQNLKLECDKHATNDEQGNGSVHGPGTISHGRAYRIYDDCARPVMTQLHLRSLREKPRMWVVKALVQF